MNGQGSVSQIATLCHRLSYAAASNSDEYNARGDPINPYCRPGWGPNVRAVYL